MSNDNEYSTMDDTSSNFPEDTDNKNSSVTTMPDDAPPTTVSVVDLAASLLDDKNITFKLSKEEEGLIQGSSVNTKRYEKN